jgi:UDP-arabinose 4-epimerase
MKILVTGGAGYVGSHVCKSLAAAGHQPIVYDNLSQGDKVAVRWGPLEVGDVSDGARLREVIGRHRPDGVVHFAALTHVAESVERPDLYYRSNVAGTMSLLEAMRELGIRVLVFSSTCAIYGVPVLVPIAEDHPTVPINPYGAGKLMIERMLRDFDSAFGLRSISLRYFNAAGADPLGEIGESHDPETHAIPLAIAAALGRSPAFQIYGNDYSTPDGSAVRDYVHVSDLADAHIAALVHLLRGGATTAINLGSGIGTSVLEVVRAVERVSDRSVPLTHRSRREGDPPVLVADARYAQSLLGWRAKQSEIDEIIRTAWNWHRKEMRTFGRTAAAVTSCSESDHGPAALYQRRRSRLE